MSDNGANKSMTTAMSALKGEEGESWRWKRVGERVPGVLLLQKAGVRGVKLEKELEEEAASTYLLQQRLFIVHPTLLHGGGGSVHDGGGRGGHDGRCAWWWWWCAVVVKMCMAVAE